MRDHTTNVGARADRVMCRTAPGGGVRREAREAVEALTRLIVTLEATAHEPVVGIRRNVG